MSPIKKRPAAKTGNIEQVDFNAKSQRGSENPESDSDEKSEIQEQIIKELKHSFEMEIETVINYLANSVHLDGIMAQEIRESLKNDIPEELGHATEVAERLKILNADVPGSLALTFSQKIVQPPADSTDVLSVIKGVIDAEKGAIAQYEKIIELADDADDYVTEDMCIKILGQEQHHLREFQGFLKALEPGSRQPKAL